MAKEFPANYSASVVEVLSAMSVSDGKNLRVQGSASMRNQLYSADYDAIEPVAYSVGLPERLKHVIKRCMDIPGLTIGDFKCGIVPEWRLFPEDAKVEDNRVENVNVPELKRRAQLLVDTKIATPEEAKEVLGLLPKKNKMTPAEFYALNDVAKFHIVRWKPQDILKGEIKLRDGRTLSLKDALQQPATTKLDCVAYVENSRFAEFSCIYAVEVKGKFIDPLLNERADIRLRQGVQDYYLDGNLFKMAKRMYSLANYNDDEATKRKLLELFNGDLGRIYSLISDISTLLYLVENANVLPLKRIRMEIDVFKARLGLVALPAVLNAEPRLLKLIDKLSTTITSRAGLLKELEVLQNDFQRILNKGAEKALKERRLLPPPDRFLP